MPEHAPGAPRVSIVIPAYNSEAYLGITLKSVIAQTYSHWETIVYNDGSTDATEAVARQFAADDRRIRVVSGENRGVAAARNRGFAETDPRSEFVVFLDNDDVWLPDMLGSLVAVLDAHAEYVGAHTLVRCIDEFGNALPDDDLEQLLVDRKGFHDGRLKPVEPSAPTTFADLAFHHWMVTPGALLVRRPIVERTGDFDPRTVPADDWDKAVRLSRSGDFGRVDEALLLWRRHAGAQSYHSSNWNAAHFRVRRKMLTDRTNTREQLRAARMGYTFTMRTTYQTAMRLARERRSEPPPARWPGHSSKQGGTSPQTSRPVCGSAVGSYTGLPGTISCRTRRASGSRKSSSSGRPAERSAALSSTELAGRGAGRGG